MAKKNHIMSAATSIMQHAIEMCDEGRSNAAIKKYLKQSQSLLRQANAKDKDAKADSPTAALRKQATPANGPVPQVPPAIAAAQAEKPKTGGMFGSKS